MRLAPFHLIMYGLKVLARIQLSSHRAVYPPYSFM